LFRLFLGAERRTKKKVSLNALAVKERLPVPVYIERTTVIPDGGIAGRGRRRVPSAT